MNGNQLGQQPPMIVCSDNPVEEERPKAVHEAMEQLNYWVESAAEAWEKLTINLSPVLVDGPRATPQPETATEAACCELAHQVRMYTDRLRTLTESIHEHLNRLDI